MLHKLTQIHRATTQRHYLRVMSFVVLGALCGALLMYVYASLTSEDKLQGTSNDSKQHMGTYVMLPVETQLQRMEGRLALPLFGTVLSLLFGFGMLRALRDKESPKEATKADSHRFHDRVLQ